MPNGFHGTQEEWERIEAPLRALDHRLEEFAHAQGMRLARSERNWPSRSLHWGDDVQRMIQIYLENADELTWNLWVCASQDRDSRRYWKHSFVRRAVPLAEIDSNLPELLPASKRTVDAWEPQDLEPATES
jgi:hypothetical protein